MYKYMYEGELKNKPHLLTFHENILVSLSTFQLALVGIYMFICIFSKKKQKQKKTTICHIKIINLFPSC